MLPEALEWASSLYFTRYHQIDLCRVDPSRYIDSATNPLAWYTHANGLLRSARRLYDDSYAEMKKLKEAPENQGKRVALRVASLGVDPL